MIVAGKPALVLAPMDGITDAPMRELWGESGSFSHAVTEFIRVSGEALPPKVFRRDVPEIAQPGCRTRSGLLVQVQILGGDPDRMAQSAANAIAAGATSVDINFGCPAPTVNRHDGGASLLRCPKRIREIVRAVRDAVPADLPVSAKLRLGWDEISAIHENAAMAAEGGATWLTIHARTRTQGYAPPVFWPPIGRVANDLGLPVVANGDIWTLDDFKRCRDETGCEHFMIGRSALARPQLPGQIAVELKINAPNPAFFLSWRDLFARLIAISETHYRAGTAKSVFKLKQWANLAHRFGDFPDFDRVKLASTAEEFLAALPPARAAVHLPA